MRKTLLTFVPLVSLLCSCSENVQTYGFFAFDTRVEFSGVGLSEENIKRMEEICLYLDKISDNYQSRDYTNVYTLNHTNEEVKIDKDLYDILKAAYEIKNHGAVNFDLMCGSLSKLWKSALESAQIPNESEIQSELNKIENSSLIFKNDNVIQRLGEAEIDLGGYIKGYALDKIKEYLIESEIKSYTISAGSSSVLIGEKQDGKAYGVGIRGLDGYSFKLKNCFISTSGTSEQNVTIDGKTYTHIVNPKTGSALALYDSVVVISQNGAFGDAMSTSLFMASEQEMIEAEQKYDIRVIAIRDNNVFYMNNDVEFDYH